MDALFIILVALDAQYTNIIFHNIRNKVALPKRDHILYRFMLDMFQKKYFHILLFCWTMAFMFTNIPKPQNKYNFVITTPIVYGNMET